MEHKSQYRWNPRDEQAEHVFNLVNSAKNALIQITENEEVLSNAGVEQLEMLYSGVVDFLDNFNKMVEV